MTLSSRPYCSPADLQAILDLVRARPAAHILDYPTLTDLQELLARPEIQAATRVWETGAGRLAGYALLNHGQTFAVLSFEVDHKAATDVLAGDMLAWGEHTYQESFHDEAVELSSSVHDDQLERIALLEANGFVREAGYVVYMERSLADPVPEAPVPPGFILRPVVGAGEDAAWISVCQAAHGTENMTLESRRSMTGTPQYDPDLDLVAVAPDGTLAAYVFANFNRDEIAACGRAIGYTDPVATHPAYQRRGLARALLSEALRRLAQRGMQTARLGTSSENIAMQKAAQAAGFRIVDRAWHFARRTS
jgi:mycothiol synthase